MVAGTLLAATTAIASGTLQASIIAAEGIGAGSLITALTIAGQTPVKAGIGAIIGGATAAGAITGAVTGGTVGSSLSGALLGASASAATAGTSLGITLGPIGLLTLGAVSTDLTFDCWKPILHDKSREPSRGIRFKDVLSDPRVKEINVQNYPEIRLRNVWNESFVITFVQLPNSEVALHAEPIS